MSNNARYDSKTKIFHWVSAGLIFTMWLLGQSFDFLPDGDPIIIGASIHYVLGAVLMILLAFRLNWKLSKGTKLPAALPGLWGTLAKSAHMAQYALLIAVLLLGILFSSSMLIEIIFSLDGLGLLGYEATISRDYPVMFALIFIFTLIGLIANLLSDLCYKIIDPRIRFD